MKLLFTVVWALLYNACLLDVTPDPYIPPPLTCDGGDEDSGR